MASLLPLQFLLLLCVALQQLSGSLKERFLKYILEPPPCRSEPEDCSSFCTVQEDCKAQGLSCCAAFCGAICSLNMPPEPPN
ncbi:WAP four-disulfide core domain protein 13 [Ictidomys tridecemlineatus]|uniref:WAP four-disulfide core domain protein 13 n=1 Tax=Ictidomys tridecemlineatus TaxID=43179 RepID=UPI00038BD4CA|nr:WAP four-disulfide core domain protein 13 [Ictidomys tridecemlineatus]KAG3263550.1 WAP four-disulfide core domain 13 [Ictidomys tridecemlineatus]